MQPLKARAKGDAPVKVNWQGYTSASDEWVGADRLRSKLITVKAKAKAKSKAKAKGPEKPRPALQVDYWICMEALFLKSLFFTEPFHICCMSHAMHLIVVFTVVQCSRFRTQAALMPSDFECSLHGM